MTSIILHKLYVYIYIYMYKHMYMAQQSWELRGSQSTVFLPGMQKSQWGNSWPMSWGPEGEEFNTCPKDNHKLQAWEEPSLSSSRARRVNLPLCFSVLPDVQQFGRCTPDLLRLLERASKTQTDLERMFSQVSYYPMVQSSPHTKFTTTVDNQTVDHSGTWSHHKSKQVQNHTTARWTLKSWCKTASDRHKSKN